MNFIFIGSYLNVPCVVDVVERERGNFLILTSVDSLVSLFSELYGKEKVYKIPVIFERFGYPHILLRDFIKSIYIKRKILKEAISYNPKKIFFFFISWNVLSSWLIKKLSLKCDVYYRPKIDITILNNNYSLRSWLRVRIASIICGTKFRSCQFNGRSIIAIDDVFLNEVKAFNYDYNICNKIIKSFIATKFKLLKETKVLVLAGGMYDVSITSYSDGMNDIIEALLTKYKVTEICIKHHPTFPLVMLDCFSKIPEIPCHLPANLISYNVDFIIAYDSATLYEAANLGKNSISTLNIIKSNNSKRVLHMKEYLKSNLQTGTISFPNNITDMKHLLNNNLLSKN